MSRQSAPSLAQVLERLAVATARADLQRRRRNAERVRRVAAGLPACVIAPEHCAVHDNSEAAACRSAAAS